MIENIYSDRKTSAGTFKYKDTEMKVFFPDGLKNYAEKCVQHFNNLSDDDILEICRGIYAAYKERTTIFARRFTIPRTKGVEHMLEYCKFESMEISGKYSESPSYFIHALSGWGHLKIIIIDGWKPCVFNNLDYKPIVVREYKKPIVKNGIVYDEMKGECTFSSGVFKNYKGRSEIEIFFDEDENDKWDFAGKCAEHIRNMPDDMLETICRGILNQYNYIKNIDNNEYVLPELGKITDILEYCCFDSADTYYSKEEIPAYILSGETKWESELNITVKGNKILFVGSERVEPFFDEDLYELMSINDLYPKKEIPVPESGIYRMAAVEFYKGGKQYHYRCEIDGVSVGDKVIIELGSRFREVRVMDIFEQEESELLLPPEEYKFILRKCIMHNS